MLVAKRRAVTSNRRRPTEIDCTTKRIYVKDKLSRPGRRKQVPDSN